MRERLTIAYDTPTSFPLPPCLPRPAPSARPHTSYIRARTAVCLHAHARTHMRRYDPQLIAEFLLADQHWRSRCRAVKSVDPRSPSRTFCDTCDGQAWMEHEFLGDPDYDGPTRCAFEGYCDDVDVPNGIGVAAGHSKLFLVFLVCLNRPPGSRATLRSINLATVCLASDVKAVGIEKVISDPGAPYDSTSVGATFRRWHEGVSLRVPEAFAGISVMPFRGWCFVWTADGMAMGEMCGTNSSFSAAQNPCNLCEDHDQRTVEGRTPCGFLACTCGAGNKHRRGCRCHFRLRTAARDADRAARGPLSASERKALGITTLQHAFTGVPCFSVARPGPKEYMHAFAEGRTGHLAAYTIWSLVHFGYASKDDIRQAAFVFDWSPGESAGFSNPTYLPDKLFTNTKVYQPDGSWVWGPHKDIKLPFSAAGIFSFTVMSIEFLRQFLPQAMPAWPPFWRAWVLHAIACTHGCLRFTFTFAELLRLEAMVVESERLLTSIPEYADIWVPKAHWILHLAHDIYLWGPIRLLMTMLKEMKNAHFKRGCRRAPRCPWGA